MVFIMTNTQSDILLFSVLILIMTLFSVLVINDHNDFVFSAGDQLIIMTLFSVLVFIMTLFSVLVFIMNLFSVQVFIMTLFSVPVFLMTLFSVLVFLLTFVFSSGVHNNFCFQCCCS